MKAIQRFLFTALATALLAAPALAESAPAKTEGAATPKSCTSNKQCASNEYCNTTPKCPSAKTQGTCTKKPEICSEIYLPVKGCNGKEYSNACFAAMKGQSNTGPANTKAAKK